MKHAFQAFHARGLSVEAYEQLLDKFARPHLQLRCILIGGTNGKGSVATYTAALLSHAGLKTGLFTSPHLQDPRERFVVDGEFILESELRSLEERIAKQTNPLQMNFFQYVTLLAWLFFIDKEVDIALLEVGLGGRLDPTNQTQPLLSAITSIGLDHTDLLGNDKRAILAEKLPISRRGATLVFAEQQAMLTTMAAQWCNKHKTELFQFGRDYWLRSRQERYCYFSSKVVGTPLGKASDANHVQINRATATALLDRLSHGREVTADSNLEEVLQQTCVPARLQSVDHFVVDLAHNDDALAQLNTTMKAPFDLILAQPRTHEWSRGMQALTSRAERIFCPHMPQTKTPQGRDFFIPNQELKTRLLSFCSEVVSEDSLQQAMQRACDRRTLICGSSRIAGEALRLLGIDITAKPLYGVPSLSSNRHALTL